VQALADALGLPRRPLRGPGGHTLGLGCNVPLDALAEPLTLKLLSGPNQVALTATIPLVVVLTTRFQSDMRGVFELQLAGWDFFNKFNIKVSGASGA
jgi:hypothetical protein